MSFEEILELTGTDDHKIASRFSSAVSPTRREKMARLVRITAVQERPWQDLFEEFLSLRVASGAAPRTIKDYRYHVERFFKQYPEAWGKYEVLRACVLHYFASLANKSACTHNLAREYLSAFCSYCVSSGYLPANPLLGIKKRKDGPKMRFLSEAAVLRLLDCPDKDTWPGIRDYALILLMLDTGIRPQEALYLEPECFNLKSQQVTIPAKYAKTRIERTIPISPSVRTAIQKVLLVRPPEWDKDVPLLANCDGKRLSPTSFNRRIKRYGKSFGTNITAYMLRHTFAINYLRNGGNVFELQRILGHTDLTMTKQYIALSREDIEAGHEKASPATRFLAKKKRLLLIKNS